MEHQKHEAVNLVEGYFKEFLKVVDQSKLTEHYNGAIIGECNYLQTRCPIPFSSHLLLIRWKGERRNFLLDLVIQIIM